MESVCEAINKQLIDANNTISSNEEAMKKLQQQLDETKLSNTTLTTENESKAKEIANLQSDITTKQNALTAAEKLVDSKTAELTKLQNELEAAKKNGANLNAEQQQQLEALQRDLDSAKALAEKAETELAGLRTERDKAVADLNLANRKLQPYQNFMNLHNTNYPTVDEQGNIMERSRLYRTPSGIWNDATDELPKVRQQLEDLQKQHAELQKKLANNPDMSAEFAELKEKSKAAEARYQADLHALTVDHAGRISQLESTLDQLRDATESITDQLNNTKRAKDSAESRLTEAESLITNLRTQLADNTSVKQQLDQAAVRMATKKAEAEMQEKAAAQKLASDDAQRQRAREVKISERAANASKSLRSIVSSQAASDERSRAVFENTISNIQIKNMVEVALQAGIDLSDADKELLLLKNEKQYTKNAAGDAERAADDKKIIELKQAAAKQLLLALRAKAKELKLDNPDGLDTAALTGNIQSKIKK